MAKKESVKKKKILFKTQNRVVFEKYKSLSSKGTCPQCGSKHKFTYFVDAVTGERFGDEYGRCDRVNSCGYYKSPIGDVLKEKSIFVPSSKVKVDYQEVDYINTIDPSHVLRSMSNGMDCLTYFLLNNFNNTSVKEVLKRYNVGSVDKWNGKATVFWQIDSEYSVRTGKIMMYNPADGKRIKKPIPLIAWVHTPINTNDFGEICDYSLQQCFFGEHLINTGADEFYVVESEKTAILGAIYKPNSQWLATGSLQNINLTRLEPFESKKLIFFPDKGKGFMDWTKKLEEFKDRFNIEISDFLEKQDGVSEGDDIGDWIIESVKAKRKRVIK